MRVAWKGLLLGIFAYLLFLLMAAPASWAVKLLRTQVPGLQAAGVEGTPWKGQAAALGVQSWMLTDARWNWRTLALLTGRFEYQLEGRRSGDTIRMRAGTTLLGSSYLADLSAELVLQGLLKEFTALPAEVSGQVIVELDKVRLAGQEQIPLLEGSIRWSGAKILSPVELLLGDVTLDLRPADNKSMGVLTAQGGQLLIDGSLELATDGEYVLDAKLSPGEQLPEDMRQGLETFTEPNRDGTYQLQLSGNLLSQLVN